MRKLKYTRELSNNFSPSHSLYVALKIIIKLKINKFFIFTYVYGILNSASSIQK